MTIAPKAAAFPAPTSAAIAEAAIAEAAIAEAAIAEAAIAEDPQVEPQNSAEGDLPASTSESAELAQTSGASANLRIAPFFNLNHTEAGGHVGFTSFGAFYPLFQTPGQNLTFLSGRLSVNNTGNFGGGLQAGYRQRLGELAIWGLYGGLDVFDTGNNTFTQAGFGAEILGDRWDIHLNTNVPLGNSRQVLAAQTQAINPQFVDNRLLIDQGLTEQIEAALTTVSLEGGLQLFDFGDGQVLWGRGGVYALGGGGSQGGLGFRLSLDHRLQNNIRLGLGLQNDPVFDTNVVLSISALLNAPDRRPPADDDSDATARLWSRAGEPLVRTNTVLVENRTDVSIPQTGIVAINPATGRPYVFRHVTPMGGMAAAAGTFEAPRDTIANTVGIAAANVDNIIYVQAGNAGGAFTIPDGVQVRSVGPTQLLSTQFGNATLPGSGSGTLPTVSGTVTMGNNTLLSGVGSPGTELEFAL